MISLFLNSTQPIDVDKNPEGGLVNLQVSSQNPYKQSGCNFRRNGSVSWKFGPEALRNKRKKFLSKIFDNDVMKEKNESIDSKARFWKCTLLKFSFICVKVFKNGTSKICGRQPLKKLR